MRNGKKVGVAGVRGQGAKCRESVGNDVAKVARIQIMKDFEGHDILYFKGNGKPWRFGSKSVIQMTLVLCGEKRISEEVWRAVR